MATMQEIIDRATDIASGSIDVPLQAATMLAESLLPQVLHEQAGKSALDPYFHAVYRKTISITLTDNVGTLPDNVLTAYVCAAEVTDINGDHASYSPYHNFLRSPDPRLAHFTVKQGTELHYLPVGGGDYDDDLEVVVPCAPEVPALATDEVDMPPEVVDDVIGALAAKMVQSYQEASR